MGRSVSYPANTVAKYYEALPDTFGKTYTYDEYDNIVHDADGNEVMHYSEEAAQADWEWFCDDLAARLQARYKSMRPVHGDVWLGREDRALLENDYAYIGVSEYCGMVCVWLAMKELDCYYADDVRRFNLAHAWANRIKAGFEQLGTLKRIGTFSNGEAVFELPAVPTEQLAH